MEKKKGEKGQKENPGMKKLLIKPADSPRKNQSNPC